MMVTVYHRIIYSTKEYNTPVKYAHKHSALLSLTDSRALFRRTKKDACIG